MTIFTHSLIHKAHTDYNYLHLIKCSPSPPRITFNNLREVNNVFILDPLEALFASWAGDSSSLWRRSTRGVSIRVGYNIYNFFILVC